MSSSSVSPVRKRKREMIFSLLSKRKRETLLIHDSLFADTIRELDATAANVIGDRKNVEIKNPNFAFEEKIEEEAPGGNVVGGERESEVESSKSLVVVLEKKRDEDTPPDDDCCPICFENFTIACKTNCGHWFCANCILQFWNYRADLQKCKCPICSRLISKLTPEASLLVLQEGEVVEALKNVQRYNRLFQGGVHGVIRKVFEFPLVIKRKFCGLMDPDRFRGNYYAMRSLAGMDSGLCLLLSNAFMLSLSTVISIFSHYLARLLSIFWPSMRTMIKTPGIKLLLSCIYNVSSFDFIPTGNLGARRLFDLCAIAVVVILSLVGICHRVILRRRVRRLAATQL